MQRSSEASYILYSILLLVISAAAQWHWTAEGIRAVDETLSEEVKFDISHYPSTFAEVQVISTAYPDHEHYRAPRVVSRAAAATNERPVKGSPEKVSIRYWDVISNSFKFLEVSLVQQHVLAWLVSNHAM